MVPTEPTPAATTRLSITEPARTGTTRPPTRPTTTPPDAPRSAGRRPAGSSAWAGAAGWPVRRELAGSAVRRWIACAWLRPAEPAARPSKPAFAALPTKPADPSPDSSHGRDRLAPVDRATRSRAPDAPAQTHQPARSNNPASTARKGSKLGMRLTGLWMSLGPGVVVGLGVGGGWWGRWAFGGGSGGYRGQCQLDLGQSGCGDAGFVAVGQVGAVDDGQSVGAADYAAAAAGAGARFQHRCLQQRHDAGDEFGVGATTAAGSGRPQRWRGDLADRARRSTTARRRLGQLRRLRRAQSKIKWSSTPAGLKQATIEAASTALTSGCTTRTSSSSASPPTGRSPSTGMPGTS